MKIFSKLNAFVLFTGLVCLNSCTKDAVSPNDFRRNYVGKYQVVEHVSSYGFPECGEPYSREKDTVIIVDYGETDSTLSVLGRDVWLNPSGYYYGYHYSLHLWNDSISSYYMSGGLGCGSYIVHNGIRISDKPD